MRFIIPTSKKSLNWVNEKYNLINRVSSGRDEYELTCIIQNAINNNELYPEHKEKLQRAMKKRGFM